ncbi:hypothetical protein Afil01_32630 [Actinorhabdospora filicis]|uniref:Radical SAM core domain-containing protein n=1 Tax=Actinorhabdospora filicis TaxID=1785913 RepID=A0A9W6WAC2_9ACTN|nr:radical SAM protein [Actinorhabdospora filicis]GLZ78456.1 hypothetical protein Afil01_32630 [Actinorhabdospora filicis]
MTTDSGPNFLIWDVTFACPLRCTHCYTESGRRRPGNLSHEDMVKVADALISFRPTQISLCGGEPLTVPRILDIARRFRDNGVKVLIYTSGWNIPAETITEMADVLEKVVVSVDGATADVHDYIRSRPGSFDRAMHTLGLLDAENDRRRAQGKPAMRFGIDTVIVRSNWHQVDDMAALVARFPNLTELHLGAVVPTGLASRPTFNEHEMLSDEQVSDLNSEATKARLQAAAPATVKVSTTDNFAVQMHPDFIATHPGFRPLEVEPDGEVRAMPIYEGTVGSLLTVDPQELWRRSRARWDDPWVVETLRGVTTRQDWAEAVRRIDYRFGSEEVRARIDKRPAFDPGESRRLTLRPATT